MRLRRRDILLLLVGWVFVAVVLVTLVVVLRSQGSAPAGGVPGPVPTYTVVFTQVTARGLYPAAEGAALAWQPDAQLVSLTATWRGTAVDQVGAPVEWVFRFYSPSRRLYYFVTVMPDGQVQSIEHARQVDLPPPVIPVEAWRLDSAEALATWLDHGGGAMLGARPGIEVSAQLNVPTPGGDPTWAVVGFDVGSDDFLTVMIHADSGEVLQTVSPSP
jgi:hypothetical protein